MKQCEKYKLDLLDYATGEMTFLTKAKQQKLFAHLRKCAVCRKAFYDYESIYALAVTETQLKRPEYRKRMDGLIEQFKSSAGAAKVPDVKVEIDSAAEAIYKFVKDYTGGSSDKKVAIPVIRDKTGLVDYPFYEAMSWLVMNDKAVYTKDQDNRPSYVSPR